MIDKLYTDYHKHLLYYCINLSNNNHSLAEDLVQETFIRAMENIHTLDELSEGQCRSWLYRTAKNIFIDKVRRISNEPNPESPLVEEDDLSEVIVNSIISPQIINLLKNQYKLTVTITDEILESDEYSFCYRNIQDLRYTTAIKHLLHYLVNL